MTTEEKIQAWDAIDTYVKKPEISDYELFNYVCQTESSVKAISVVRRVKDYSYHEAVWWLFEEERNSKNERLAIKIKNHLKSLPILHNMFSPRELQLFRHEAVEYSLLRSLYMRKKDFTIDVFEQIAPRILRAKDINVDVIAQSGKSAITTFAWRVYDKMLADFEENKFNL